MINELDQVGRKPSADMLGIVKHDRERVIALQLTNDLDMGHRRSGFSGYAAMLTREARSSRLWCLLNLDAIAEHRPRFFFDHILRQDNTGAHANDPKRNKNDPLQILSFSGHLTPGFAARAMRGPQRLPSRWHSALARGRNTRC